MNQTQTLHLALKKLMRSRGRTYADAAKVLGLSEASIKRLFSKNALSLTRFESLCNWLHVDIHDLVRMSRDHEPLATQLSEEQESELLADGGLLLLSHLLLNHWSVDEILETYAMSRPELTRRMFRLQEIGLVEVLPFDRVRLKTARNFRWRKDGPVQKFFEDRVLGEFLSSPLMNRERKWNSSAACCPASPFCTSMNELPNWPVRWTAWWNRISVCRPVSGWARACVLLSGPGNSLDLHSFGALNEPRLFRSVGAEFDKAPEEFPQAFFGFCVCEFSALIYQGVCPGNVQSALGPWPCPQCS